MKGRLKIYLAIAVVLLAHTSAAEGKVIYVDDGDGGVMLAGAMPKGMAGVASEKVVVTVGQENCDVRGTDSLAIQKALDLALGKAPKGGRQVIVKAGTYTIYGSLYIRGPVTLKGEGAKTILKKAPLYITALAKPLAADAVELEVKDIGPIKPGWGLSLNPGGPWATSIRYAVEVNGNSIKMDRPRNKELKFPQGPLDAGVNVQTSYPLIQILGVEGAVIEDLVLDGNLAENKDMQGDDRNGCIYMCAAAPGQEGGPGKHVVRRCVLRDFAGDGISWQGPADVTVEDVECTGMKGNRLHPGTNAVRPIVRNCRSHHNGGSGIYVCWDVKNGRFEQNGAGRQRCGRHLHGARRLGLPVRGQPGSPQPGAGGLAARPNVPARPLHVREERRGGQHRSRVLYLSRHRRYGPD
jgi:hypothetical protein